MKKNSKKKRRLVKLEKLVKRWEFCSRCDLSETRENVVFYRGHPCAKILAIGEAPGETEDQEGVPFVGKSGKELDAMFVDCGLSLKKHIFVANVLGCRPPNNDNPKPNQVRRCSPRIERLIEIVNPKVILLLGGQAALHMAGVTQVGQWKGRFVTVRILGGDVTFPAIVTYHPSYYLRRGRNEKIKKEITSHIQRAVDFVNGE